MAKIDRDHVRQLLQRAESSDTDDKGRTLEDVAIYLFEAIPGVEVEGRRVLDAALSEEIDVVLRNNQEKQGLPNLGHVIFVECKNWGDTVGSDAVTRFATKIKLRGENFGVLLTKAGISGARREWPHSAYFELLMELRHCTIVVLDEREITGVKSGERLAELIMKKWRELKTRRGLYKATDEELNRPEFQTGLSEAIRAYRSKIAAEFLSRAQAPTTRHVALDTVRTARERLASAVQAAQNSSDDPLWFGPRDALVDFGAAAVDLVRLSERHTEASAQWLEIAADLNGPSRPRAFVAGELWNVLTDYYIRQAEGESELDAHSAALSLLQLAIDQVGQIDSIEIEPEDYEVES